jgi:glutamine cyclotransferase
MGFKQCLCVRYLLLVFFWTYSLALYAVVERFVPAIVNKLAHDRQAFTQGLAIEEDQLYESTGLYGKSSLRQLDILTGKILQKHVLPSEIFGEGLAVFPNQIIQISWKEEHAFIYERASLQLNKMLFYTGEGWGLCRDDNTVWMSNGTAKLVQRDRRTFAPLQTLHVRLEGKPVLYLNDLECDGEHLYANVWQQDYLLRIDKKTGEVTGIIDASQLLSPQEKARLRPDEVLNGIAFRPKTGTFFLTGKNWPWIFEVQFIPQKL